MSSKTIQDEDIRDVVVDGNFYNNNENILRKNAKIKWTPEMVEELTTCTKSILHFAENHFFITTLDEGKQKIKLYKAQKRVLKALNKNRFVVVLASRQTGKALALDTPIPTPNGWTTMGSLKDNDSVYDENGNECHVLKAHDIRHNRKCFKVCFDNGEEIIADAEHLWFTQSKNERKRINDVKGSVKNTQEIFDTLLNANNEPNHRIPICWGGVNKQEESFLIDPYILGLWLGDGTKAENAITIGSRDLEHLKSQIQTCGGHILSIKEYHPDVYTVRINYINGISFRKSLAQCELLNNKHIPEKYLNGSRSQRMQLLRGLMDSDGYISDKGFANFDNTNKKLALNVKCLVESLGYKATFKSHFPSYKGKKCSECFSVAFTPRENVCTVPFKLSRINHIDKHDSKRRAHFHYITDIQETPSVPVRCITVDSENSLYLCGKQYIPTHNTTNITIFALWMVCFQKDKRIGIIANKESTAQEIFARIRMAYEQIPLHLKPGVKSWRKDGFVLENDSSITVSSTSASGPRGNTVNVLLIDEAAFIPPEIMKELWKGAIPTISSSKTSKIFVISTANGISNKFYELVKEAETGIGENGSKSEWTKEQINWEEVPGRDEAWKNQQIQLLGSEKDFDQEYGNKFIADGKTFLDELRYKEIKASLPNEPYLMLDEGYYKIYKLPAPNRLYVAGGDIGEGIGRSNSVVQILDITNLEEIEQVAVYANPNISPYHFARKVYEIMVDWGRPPFLAEDNNQGAQVLEILNREYHYENIVTYNLSSDAYYQKGNRLGLHSHTNVKYRGVSNFRYFFENKKTIILNDLDTLDELVTFVRKPNGTFAKQTDKHFDDRVLSLIWAMFILEPILAKNYFEIVSYDEQKHIKEIHNLYNKNPHIKLSPLLTGLLDTYITTQDTGIHQNVLIPGGEYIGTEMERESLEFYKYLVRDCIIEEKQQKKEEKEPLPTHRSVFVF